MFQTTNQNMYGDLPIKNGGSFHSYVPNNQNMYHSKTPTARSSELCTELLFGVLMSKGSRTMHHC